MMYETEAAFSWGNSTYVDMACGDVVTYHGITLRLCSLAGAGCQVEVNGTGVQLPVARRQLPTVVDGLRLFAADTRRVKHLTSDPAIHGLVTRDALLCISDATRPLLDPNQYVFPVERSDSFIWSMEESSHMFAYLGRADWIGPGHIRSHEGIDINMHDARGLKRHPVVAVEAGTIHWVIQATKEEGCILLESASQPGIYYVYKHVYNPHVLVAPGQHVDAGEPIAHIWGDHSWGHLHFAVVQRNQVPVYNDRYHRLVNCFPQLYELWHGATQFNPRIWPGGLFTFGRDHWMVENRRREHAYADVVGYGWQLGLWCPAGAVEMAQAGPGTGNARLARVLHKGTPAEAVNPDTGYEFTVRVAPGVYRVRAQVGDCLAATWQEVFFCDQPVGVYALPAGEYAWTSTVDVMVTSHQLSIRLELCDGETPAGLSEFHFWRIA